jgi:AsmA family
MKFIKIVFFGFLALCLIACTGVFILFQIFDSDQYLPKLTQKASLVLGRPVSVEHVGLGLSSRGITFDAWPLVIADDPDFTSQPFIKIDRVRISLDLRSLVLERKVQITDILLQSPQIHFIRSREGNINARNISQVIQPAQENRDVSRLSNGPQSGRLPFPVKSPKGGVFASRVIIQDASISFIDQNQAMPLDVWLRHINVTLNDLSLSKPIQISFTASPLVFKSTSTDEMQDNPVFKRVTGAVQFNMPDLQGDIIVADGVIRNFNIIKIVLSSAPASFGGLGGIAGKLGTEDTAVEKAEVKFSYHDNTAFIDDFLLKTNILEFTAQGSVDRGLNTDMQTMLRLNAGISAALVNELEVLKFFCDDSDRIAIGASIKGVYPHLKYKTDKDFKKKSKKAFHAMFRQLLGA